MKDSKKTLLPALFAMGTGLAAQPAAAIELGEINVQSTLGQPLRASIAYALGPNEQIGDYCVTLKPGLSNTGLPAVTSANISVANGIISLTGRSAIREPLMSLRLDVACPYTPNLSREYMLFIDPAAPIRAAVAAQPTVQPAPAVEPAPTVTRPAAQPAQQPAARRASASRAPIDVAATYRVQPGDSLSQIAERIENRPVGLWQAVAQIFEANPNAFIDNDPNKLKAGSLLVMPNFAAGDAAPTFAAAPVVESAAPTAAERNPTPQAATVEPVPLADVDDTAVLEPAVEPAAEALEPGDVVLDAENPFVGSAEPEVGLPDTEVEATTPASSPNVPVATLVQPERSEPAGTNWLLWLVGGGIALIVGLLMFGRRGRDLGDPEAVATAASHPMRRSSDSAVVEALPDDDDPTEENLALDADLAIGSGLSESTDVEIDHDFGHAAGDTKLDLEFPLEEEAAQLRSTDAIPAPERDEDLVVEEVLPDSTDYDMSVIMDATQVPDHESVTERDLRAVEVDADSDDDTASYTLDQEIDYQILEQDYEDELTATQALNKEIEKAAAELAERLGGDAGDNDKTADLKLATVTELDVGARRDDDDSISDLDDTGVNEELTAEMPGDEQTVEMPPRGDDTVEMPKKSKKA